SANREHSNAEKPRHQLSHTRTLPRLEDIVKEEEIHEKKTRDQRHIDHSSHTTNCTSTDASQPRMTFPTPAQATSSRQSRGLALYSRRVRVHRIFRGATCVRSHLVRRRLQ